MMKKTKEFVNEFIAAVKTKLTNLSERRITNNKNKGKLFPQKLL